MPIHWGEVTIASPTADSFSTGYERLLNQRLRSSGFLLKALQILAAHVLTELGRLELLLAVHPWLSRRYGSAQRTLQREDTLLQ